MQDEPLTPNFWLSEFLRSDIAFRRQIDNTPGPEVLNRIKGLLAPRLQRVRNVLCAPIHITSGYRSPKLNAIVRGSKASQHLEGRAVDFICPTFGTPLRICRHLRDRASDFDYDQLIWEGAWVHISFTEEKPRREVLTAHFSEGGVTYSKGV